MNNIKLVSYKMTHDTGFAPNPFHGFLTLANCKSGIRRSSKRKKGDWIAGFTSRALCNDEVGEERLVYLMQIDKIIPYEDYWQNPDYEVKKPNLKSKEFKYRFGDNIYEPLKNGAISVKEFKQNENCCHCEKNKDDDLSGLNVLISYNFYYFGCKPVKLPENRRPNIPYGSAKCGVYTDAEKADKFLDHIRNKYRKGITDYPMQYDLIRKKLFNKGKCG